MKNKKPKISVEVTQEEFDLYRWWAERSGTTLSELVRTSVLRTIPREQVLKFFPNPTAEAIEAAYQVLEAEDTGKLPQPAAAPAPLPPNVTRLPIVERGTTRHPCANLDPKIPANFTARDCQGSCTSPLQPGRVCFWNSMSAQNCQVFRRRKYAAAP